MIIDTLQNIARYRGLGENFAKAVDFLESADVFALPLGNFEIDGRAAYGFVTEKSLERENLRWEAHEVYADIQLNLGGAERIGWLPLAGQPTEAPYNPEKDIAFYTEPSKGLECRLHPGDFMIFLPGELHRPDCPVPGEPMARKMVVKVRV